MKRIVLAFLALVLMLGLAPAGHAARAEVRAGLLPVPELVKDINPSGDAFLPQAQYQFIDVGGTLFFNAYEPTHGDELWKSDGTTTGTALVKDIRPGASPSSPNYFAAANGKLLFSANDGSHGTELWASNGSDAGTQMLKDINPGGPDSKPVSLTRVGTEIFFVANHSEDAFQLWKSNGTPGGPALVKVISPSEDPAQPDPFSLTALGGSLFFTNFVDPNHSQLWKSDGSPSGTLVVSDFQGLSSLTAVDSMLYFSAFAGDAGKELWKSDGTADGTVLVEDINPQYQASSDPQRMINVNGTLFFSAFDGQDRQLWKSTRYDVTVMVKRINPFDSSMNYSFCPAAPCPYPYEANLNGTLYFVADDGTHGFELWKSDGSESGTVLVKDIVAGSGSSNPTNLTEVCGRLFFAAGGDLWVSDGTESGTRKIKSYTTRPRLLTRVGSDLFFAANDGLSGSELWKVYGCMPQAYFLPVVLK